MTNNTPKNDGKVRDIDIRLEFMKRNLKFFEQPDMEFVNEFGVNSTNVVDLAAFDFKNNIFYGFEIKSEQDNTSRLYKQLTAYITFFQIVYVIVHKKHLEETMEIINSVKHFDKIGVIVVSGDVKHLEFKEIKQARRYTQVYNMFVQNLDLEELRVLAVKYNLPIEGSKKVLLGKLRRYVKMDDIFEGIHNKLNKYYFRKCPACLSKLYYKRNAGRGGVQYICYKCGVQIEGF